jgi:hypothetical protein
MGVHNFKELRSHVGHDIECVHYAEQNVAVECVTCGCVLFDFDRPEPYRTLQERGIFVPDDPDDEDGDDPCG